MESVQPRVTLLTRVQAQQIPASIARQRRPAAGDRQPRQGLPRRWDVAATGHYDSDILDAGNTSTWGALRWTVSTPAGTSAALRTRSGNTSKPDETWSEWSAAMTVAAGEQIRSPKARYLQWRAVLSGKPGVTPVLTSVTAAYQPRNIRPEVKSITVHPAGNGVPATVFQR